MGTTPAATTPRPAYRLFNANAVAIAAFLCSPLGGAVLIAVNFVRLGKPRKGAFAVLAGLIATLPAVLINWNGPTPVGSVASVALALLLFFCTWQIAHEIQGDTVQEHLEAGGQLATNFTAFLTGIATLATVVALSYAVFFALQPRKVVVGTNEILYSGLTSRSTAIALGNQLKNDPSFLHRGTTVLIDREVGSRTLSFVVQDGAWDQAGILSSFEEFARKAAPTLGGLPIDIQLLDTRQDVEAKSTVGETCFDSNHCVTYEGTATEDEADALCHQLESTTLFRGQPANVFLLRHDGEGTTLTFVLADQAWNNSRTVADLETIARNAAPAIGGLPLVLHLVNSKLELQKEVLVDPEPEAESDAPR
jgi:hypothetical protein